MNCRFFLDIFVFAAALACSRGDSASAHGKADPVSRDDGVAPRPAVIAPATRPYRVIPVASAGTISGTVDFRGVIAGDTIIHPTVDQTVCGNSISQKRLTRSGTRVGGAIVWITDITSGKALPLERLFELTNDHCILDPFVQVIFTNSTLNVASEDRVLHTNRLINVATGRYVGIAPFNDDGEVVPLDHSFKEQAEIEVVCEQHPWTRAWLAVLDHPYFATTSNTGTFTIDQIPPGRYRVRAWHPSVGVADDSVTVVAGQTASVAFRIGPAPSAPVPAPVTPAAAASSTPSTASSTPASSTTPATVPPPRR